MSTITLTARPVSGKRDRTCQACGCGYIGWHVALCLDCEATALYTVVHAY